METCNRTLKQLRFNYPSLRVPPSLALQTKAVATRNSLTKVVSLQAGTRWKPLVLRKVWRDLSRSPPISGHINQWLRVGSRRIRQPRSPNRSWSVLPPLRVHSVSWPTILDPPASASGLLAPWPWRTQARLKIRLGEIWWRIGKFWKTPSLEGVTWNEVCVDTSHVVDLSTHAGGSTNYRLSNARHIAAAVWHFPQNERSWTWKDVFGWIQASSRPILSNPFMY